MSPKVLRLLVGAAIVLASSSCSQSTQNTSQTLPKVQRSTGPATSTIGLNVKITEYPAIASPKLITIGPDGAVWFESGSNEPLGPLYVYRFAANDGQGRFYALSSLLKTLYPPAQSWFENGPIVSYAGRVWFSFQANIAPGYDQYVTGGLVQMTPTGTAVSLSSIYFDCTVGAVAVRGNDLWFVPMAFLTSSNNAVVYVYSFASNRLQFVRFVRLSETNLSAEFAEAIRLGPDGNMYILGAFGSGDGYVWKVSPAGRVLGEFRVGLAFFPTDMAFGSDGALWITSDAGFIRMRTDGTRALYALPSKSSRPAAITLGRDGALWFIDIGTNAIGRITISGSVSEYPVPTANAFGKGITGGSGIIACPVGIAACGSGSIWFTEPNTGKLGKIQF